MKPVHLLAVALLPLTATAAHASSDSAWSAFQADVSKACVTAAKGLIENGRALADPYGSEHFGLAVVTGNAKGAKVTISTICVYDKKTKRAEIGGEIPADQLLVKP
ncbi:hypothetical protein EPK99_20765 [Neorhizobium lilium]|uniref:Uncharacterized protein n=1 Tax=Neorhizobium lilium TaxID=2503024 RepID=A0A444LE08_9HYPH|nr:hypothetical protein [Neorhizobium lilium]RWX76083.1 hypothetical protein EPK99_20765 [Neorhizobium lilium]